MIEKEIPPKDKILLNPLHQYAIYGKFPYFMIIHILLLEFNTLQVIITISEISQYFRAQEISFINTLVSSSQKEKKDYPKKTYLYSIEDLQKHINNSVNKMIEANDTFFNTIRYVDEKDTEIEIESFNMNVIYKNNTNKLNNIGYPMPLKRNYQISKNYLGPFNKNYSDDDIKKYIDSIFQFEIEYKFKIYFTRYYKKYQECFIWYLQQTYDFSQRAHFTVSLEINNEQCEEKTSFSRSEIIMITHMWIHFIVFFLAILSVIFCLHSFHITNKLRKYKDILIENQKGKKIKNPKILKEIETIEKVSIRWELILIFSNLFQILGALVSFLKQKNMNYSTNIVIALGAFLCYISVGKYMNYASNYNIFFHSLSNLDSIFIPFLLATIPIFIAFTLVALCLFWNSERLTNLNDTVKTLFLLLTGDM